MTQFFKYCQPAQNQPKSQIWFNENCSLRDLCIMTLVGATPSWENSTWPNVCIHPYIYIYIDVSLVLEFPHEMQKSSQ